MLDLDQRFEAARRELHDHLETITIAPASKVIRRHRRRRYTTATVAIMLATAGVVAIAARDNAPITPASTLDSQGAPSVTYSAPPANMTTPIATEWRRLVETALAGAGWNLTIGSVYENPNLTGGAPYVTAVALVGDGRIVFQVTPFDGSYQTDPEWQMEVAGATTPGTSIPEGNLFVFDYPNTPVRQVSIVTTYGIVMIHAEMIPTATLPDVDVFTSVATDLAREARHQLYAQAGS